MCICCWGCREEVTAAAAAAAMMALKCCDLEGIGGGGKRLWLECIISRNLSVSRECDRMWRVCFIWLGNVAEQYMQGYMRLLLLLPPLLPGLPVADGEGEGDKELAGEDPRPSALALLSAPATNPDPPPPPLEPATPPTTDDVASAAAPVASCNQTRTETVNFLSIQYLCIVCESVSSDSKSFVSSSYRQREREW